MTGLRPPTTDAPVPAEVVVVGSINEDVFLRLDRSVRPGETVAASAVERSAGGKGANQAVAAARCGRRVAMLGAVGQDDAGDRMLAGLEQAGVDTSMVLRLPDAPTGTAYITVTPDGENTIIVEPGANSLVSAAQVAASPALASAKVVLAQLEVPVDAVYAAIEVARRDAGHDPCLVVTMAPARIVPSDLLAGLNPMLVNEHEAAFYLGRKSISDDPRGAAWDLLGLGVRSAVITMGAQGAVYADRTGVRSRPAVPVAEVVDTTGAGDAFAGALAAALAGGGSLDVAVEAGLDYASGVITRFGAR